MHTHTCFVPVFSATTLSYAPNTTFSTFPATYIHYYSPMPIIIVWLMNRQTLDLDRLGGGWTVYILHFWNRQGRWVGAVGTDRRLPHLCLPYLSLCSCLPPAAPLPHLLPCCTTLVPLLSSGRRRRRKDKEGRDGKGGRWFALASVGFSLIFALPHHLALWGLPLACLPFALCLLHLHCLAFAAFVAHACAWHAGTFSTGSGMGRWRGWAQTQLLSSLEV